ncbi:MAG: TetR/AcrR family transcriptional regulator [Burkholderiales bacterium]|nr:TetR/AcrR family transcriptional regulator [Burkholderiales bacterium]
MSTSDDLIAECTRLIAQDGLKALSLRKLAERVGIKAPSIYEYFESKEALLDAARHQAMAELGRALVARTPAGGTPRAQLMAAAMGYVHFAQDQPSLFALLFMEMPSRRQGLADAPSPQSPYAHLLMLAQAFLGADSRDAESLSFGIWSLVHGVAVLRQTHLRDFAAPLLDGAQANLAALLDGWALKGASAASPAAIHPAANGAAA